MEPPRTSREFLDTTTLSFPERIRKPVADEQFGKFVEVIKKLYGNIPLLDAMQVPSRVVISRLGTYLARTTLYDYPANRHSVGRQKVPPRMRIKARIWISDI